MVLALGDQFVEIENEVGEHGPSGEFYGVDFFVWWRLTVADGFFCFLGLGAEVSQVFVESLLEDGLLLGLWVATDGGAEQQGEACFVIGLGSEHPLSEGAGSLEELHIVHQGKGLKWGVAALALEAVAFAVWGIEGGHVRGWRGAFPEGVKAAAVEGLAVVLNVVFGIGAAESDGLPDVFGLVRADAFAAHFWAEQA